MATITTTTAAEINPTSGPVNVLAALVALVWIVLGGGGAATSRSFVRRSRQV